MFEVEVYNLRLNAWRKISVVPPDVSVSKVECVFLNGVVYWSTMDPSQHSTFILSFDFGSEEFKRIRLPRAEHNWAGFMSYGFLKCVLPTRVYVSCSLGFTANGRFLMVVPGTFAEESNLVLYDPQSQQPSNTGIETMKPCGYVDAY
ncbi:hypothetical protein CerSpe_101530 [Prunus speciosa]